MLVDNPIINSPFKEPNMWWAYEEGQPVLRLGRRPAGYYLKPRTRGEQVALFEEEFVELTMVNTIRERVKAWRERNYPGVTNITRQLLNYWHNPERERKIFFCQLEAVETLIWLIEGPPADRQGIDIPKDNELVRYACKMATGSGKTVVMGMVIAWQVLNKLINPQDRRFSDAVLILCPNLTIRERLQVLLPAHKQNYYVRFDLLPPGLFPRLNQGRFFVTNWHTLLPVDDSRSKSVVQRGVESDTAFCRRVLKELGEKSHILVINDEAHHAHRPAPLAEETKKELTKEEIAEREEATVWVNGLDRIQRVRGINFCADFSATPFYIRGSGYPEGEPFPWVVSDFGLVDAIECGIVKIPRVPVDDNTGALIPRYFRLWEWINEQLPQSERSTTRRRAKPESVLREAEDALATLASEWKKTFDAWEKANQPVPPVMIVVCDNTDLAQLVHQHIARGNILSELANEEGQEVTFRIDTKLLAEAEAAKEEETKADAAERLRKTVDTVGKTEWDGEGEPPGKNIRAVVAVGMLNEGWDAQNVTQILGLRAFTSQLLCEQVVGRGLRRLNYDDFNEPEYVDVYGVPFEVIPVKKKPASRSDTPKVSTLIRALKEREELAITFPRVEGYVFDVKQRININLNGVPYLVVDPRQAPTEVLTKPQVGYRIGRPDRLGPGKEVLQDRNPFHREKRLQATVYEIAATVTERLKGKREDWNARHILFPQVLEIVWQYIEEKVRINDPSVPLEDLALLKYRQVIVDRLSGAIEPDEEAGERPLLPVIEQFRPVGSTRDVMFRTNRHAVGTTKSHISHVVLDTEKWEHSVAYRLERIDEVFSYARNDHLDFVIPYSWQDVDHEYRPDFLVRWKTDQGEVKVILEVKGLESEKDRQKRLAAERWVKAVNRLGEFGRWAYCVCRHPQRVREDILQAVGRISR
ncbi:DEAD/DEAH box helicase family protein [candidate division WOR-3 bacterium]|nr:DEAD/DEAH box helicase family protein [candidate division WOR-3 bacterium]